MPCSRFYEDDFIQLGTLDGTVEGYGSAPFHLYGFMNGDTDQVRMAKESGPLPWFFPDRFRVNFFRPLSSWLLSVDHSVWGHRPAGYQAVTMVWYLAIVVLLGAILRTVLADSPGRGWGVSVVASVLFVMNGSHWYAVSYLAARWYLITTALGLAGLLAHIRWREREWGPGRVVALIALALSLQVLSQEFGSSLRGLSLEGPADS